MTLITQILAPLMPVIVQILWQFLKTKGISEANKKKFIESIQSIDALQSVNLHDDFQDIEDEFDRRDKL